MKSIMAVFLAALAVCTVEVQDTLWLAVRVVFLVVIVLHVLNETCRKTFSNFNCRIVNTTRFHCLLTA